MSAERDRTHVTLRIGAAQTLAWGSSYYLPAILAVPLARDIGVGVPLVFAAFSAALAVSALSGPLAGRMIDRHGGRPVLVASSVLFACALAALSQVQGGVGLFAAWALMGLAMGCGLYDAAFASLVRLYGAGARPSITGVTLMAGFASTIGWPATAWMDAHLGWRGACLVWAAVHLASALLFYAWLPAVSGVVHAASAAAAESPAPLPPRSAMRVSVLLAVVFASSWFGSTAMAAHLPPLLQAAGASLAVAVGVGALVGPAQVAGRVFEFAWLRRFHPLLSARLAALAHPIGVCVLLSVGPVAAPAFAILHGAGNGILTIANGALPLALFGARGYGARQGWLMMPARFMQALAPFLFGLALERMGAGALWITAGLGLLSFAALLCIGHAARGRD